MKSVYNFVVTPIGERYNNTKKVDGGDLILNTEIYNHQFVNIIAKVISTPIIGDTDIKPGDEVIIHHNVFRRWHNVKGIEKNSRSYFDESTYFINQDQIFLYKRNGEWNAPKGFCFVKPLKETDDPLNINREFIFLLYYITNFMSTINLLTNRIMHGIVFIIFTYTNLPY